nr:ATP-binding protein [[Clostridium] symbiosum]
MISADRRLFAKVIGNLISNAYHYSPAGEKIHIRVEDTDQGVQFTVENTGVHIPEQEIADLFEAFTRREQSRNRETGGSGLGLAIVRMVLELHQFPYAMENTEDGMRFRILFPRRPHAS